jgi:hypothetical protein
MLLNNQLHACFLTAIKKVNVVVKTALHSIITTLAREDEKDGRETVALVKMGYYLAPAWAANGASSPLRTSGSLTTHLSQVPFDFDVAFPIPKSSKLLQPLVSLIKDKKVVMKLHRSRRLDNRFAITVDLLDPASHFMSIADSRRQTNQSRGGRKLHDHFFPDGATIWVLKEVDLIQND